MLIGAIPGLIAGSSCISKCYGLEKPWLRITRIPAATLRFTVSTRVNAKYNLFAWSNSSQFSRLPHAENESGKDKTQKKKKGALWPSVVHGFYDDTERKSFRLSIGNWPPPKSQLRARFPHDLHGRTRHAQPTNPARYYALLCFYWTLGLCQFSHPHADRALWW